MFYYAWKTSWWFQADWQWVWFCRRSTVASLRFEFCACAKWVFHVFLLTIWRCGWKETGIVSWLILTMTFSLRAASFSFFVQKLRTVSFKLCWVPFSWARPMICAMSSWFIFGVRVSILYILLFTVLRSWPSIWILHFTFTTALSLFFLDWRLFHLSFGADIFYFPVVNLQTEFGLLVFRGFCFKQIDSWLNLN